MTSLIVLSLLTLTPGIQLADNVAGRHVALGEGRIRFVSDDDDKKPSLDAMTQEELVAELRRLDETKPSLVGPIVLTAVGVALFVPGYIALNVFAGALLGSSGGGVGALISYLAFIGVGLVCIAGIVLAIIGTVKLILRIVAKVRHGAEVAAVQERLDTVRSQPEIAPPPPAPAPEMLPPPPPPPQANLVIPGAMQTVWTF